MILTAPRGRAAAALLTLALASLPASATLPAAAVPGTAVADALAQQLAEPVNQPALQPIAQQQDPPPVLSLDDVSPARLEDGDDLTLTVTLTPAATVDDGEITVTMDRTVPISRSLLAAWQAQTVPGGHPEVVTVPLDEPLDAGASRTLDIEISADELGLRSWDDWGPRGVEIILSDGDEVAASTRTVVVWGSPAASLAPLPLSLLVPVTTTSVGVPGLVPGLGPVVADGAGAAQDPTTAETPEGGEPSDPGDPLGPGGAPTPGETSSDPASVEGPADGETTTGEAPTTGVEPGPDGDAGASGDPPTDNDPTPTEAPAGDLADRAGSAVAEIADALAGTGATLALDPLLLDGTADVFDTSLMTVAADERLLALPVGDADLAALAHLERADLARRLTEDAVDRIGVLTGHVVPALAWPASDRPDSTTVELAHGSPASATVLPGSALPTSELVSYAVGSRADLTVPSQRSIPIPVLLTEDRLGSILDGTLAAWSGETTTELDAVQSRQLLLAELAVIFRERPSDPRPLLVSYDRSETLDPARLGDVAAALADAPWVELTSLHDLLLMPAPTWERAQLPTRHVEAGEITAAGMADAEATERLAEVVSAMTAQPPAVVMGSLLAVRTAVSTGWRDDPDARTALISDWHGRLESAAGAVRATPTSPINLIAATAELPVRVTNDGEFDADVHVVVDPDDPRLVAPDPVPLTVPAGGSATALVPVRAIGSGDLPVAVRLETADGLQIGVDTTIVVRVRAGWEGYGVTAVGIVLVLLVVIGLVRRIRRGVRVPTGDATPVIAGDPGAPTSHHPTGHPPAGVHDSPTTEHPTTEDRP